MNIKDKVVVITGASSGIGRATALECARRGAIVVGVARNGSVLEEVAAQCRRTSPHSFIESMDVTDADAMDALAKRVYGKCGRIDAWVNNAAVALFGRFEEIPMKDFRQVIETNLWGYIHGSRAVLPYFREQGKGTLINVSSVVAELGQPFSSPYTISKFAIRGLSECLYQELLDTDIHVCTVYPGTVDTPLFYFGANFLGRSARAMEPIYPPEEIAHAIVSLIRRPRREVFVGAGPKIAHAAHAVLPGLTQRLFASRVRKQHFEDRPAPPSDGNLFEPAESGYGVTGGWAGPRAGGSKAMPVLGGVIAGAGAATAGWLWLRRRHH